MAPGDEDPGIIAAARRGDRAAWEQLYRHLHPRLRAFFARRMGRETAEDAVNETLAKAIAGITRYEPGATGFDGWVFGIARHVHADHYRRSARDRRERQVAHRVDGSGPENSLPVDHDLDLRDDHARLRAHFDRLDPGEQEILELRVVAGLSSDQVAALLGKSPGAVRTAQSRALTHLRHLVEADRVDA
ncbi:MAG TPA: sigma-70 family RNA polymerase sigma factor [Acidimicrobiales bacterium]|nr:sigma-70 family RNA polymerase sigma factor [Acidimicrobiales bacterium]